MNISYRSSLLIAGTLTFLSGCATPYTPYYKYAVTYDAFPQSATVVCNGIPKGYAPVTLTYTANKEEDSLTLQSCKAIWQSGAEANYATKINLHEAPRQSTITAARPKKAAGLKDDMQFDYQKKQDDEALRLKKAAHNLEQQRLELERQTLQQLINAALIATDTP